MNKAKLDIGRLEKNLNLKDFIHFQGGYLYTPMSIVFYVLTSFDKALIEMTIKSSPKKKIGIIVPNLKKEDKKILEHLNVSFIIQDKEAQLYGIDSVIKVKLRSEDSKTFPFTKIISPAGFEVLDSLLSIKDEKLINYNFLSMSKEYNLNQSKLSQISQVTKTKSPIELKKWIIDLDISWWIEAFNDSKARRQLTPFKTDLSLISNHFSIPAIMKDLKKSETWSHTVFYSGPELLKRAGYLKDPNFYICCQEGTEEKIIKKYKLLPTGRSGTKSSLKISIIRKSFDKESFFSKTTPQNIYRYNTLRMLWGIQSVDERIQESRLAALRTYLNEFRV
jgi:hypothetical protein